MTDAVKAETTRLPRWKLALFWGVLVVALLGAAELAAGIGLRWLRGYDGEHLYQYAFDPYKNILPTPGFVDTRGVQHNAVGFRRRTEVQVVKPAGTFRVFLLGASTAYGLGGLWRHIERRYPVLRNEETIDAYLEAMLQDSLPDVTVEVINAAITSTWTHHNLIYLNQTILHYAPDLVLFLDGFNDFFRIQPDHDQFASYAYGQPARVIMGDPTVKSLAFANGWWLFRRSAAAHVTSRGLQTIGRLFASAPNRDPIDVDTAMARLERIFPAAALAMHRRAGLILADEGVDAVFMLQPLLILDRDRAATPVERELFEFNVSSYRPNWEAFMHRAVAFVTAQESAMAARVGATFLDLSRPFDGITDQVFTDYAHLTPRGNQVVAQRIASHVLPRIRARLAEPAR